MDDLTVKELRRKKREAEAKIAAAVSDIFEDFKRDTDSHYTDQSISIDMVYSREIGQRMPEAIVSGASINMEIF